MIEENKNINVDGAWSNLHTRLQQDGLIPPVVYRQPMLVYIKWMGIAALLCVCLSLAIYRNSVRPTPASLLTLQNNEAGNTLVTTLTDNSIVYLWGGSRFSYPEHFAHDKRLVSLEGEALFDVSGNRECPFIIETEQILVEVLGTAFNIKSEEKKMFELSVQRGTVKVTAKEDGTSLLIDAGETVRLEKGFLHKSISPKGNLFQSYTQQMRFKDETLDNILRVINITGTQPVVLTDPAIGMRKLTVTIPGNSIDATTELICLALNLKQTVKQDTLFISQP